jgi:hypothetical protein
MLHHFPKASFKPANSPQKEFGAKALCSDFGLVHRGTMK